MKLVQIVFILSAAFLFLPAVNVQKVFAQTKKTKSKPSSGVPTSKSKKTTGGAEIEAGKQLIAKSDCGGCHKADVKLVGPSYKDVAKKYPATEANYTLLAAKLIKGGSGSWGAIPMSAHPQLAPVDAKKMIKYILAQK